MQSFHQKRLRELESGSAGSLQDALSRATESENELRSLKQRFAELQATTTNTGVVTSTNSHSDSVHFDAEVSALREKLSARDADVEALKQRVSEVVVKEQQLLQQLSASQQAAAESQSALVAREAEMQFIRQQLLTKAEGDRNEITALESNISLLHAAVASRDKELQSLKLQPIHSSNDGAKTVTQLEKDLKFAEDSNERLLQKHQESLELLAMKSSQISVLSSRLKLAEEKLLPIEARSPEYLALFKEKDALSKKASLLQNELLKIKEQYLQAISKERLSSLGHIPILEQKIQQSKGMGQLPRTMDGDTSKEIKDLKQSHEAQLLEKEARIKELTTALIESKALHSKLESANTLLNRKLKETREISKHLVADSHDLEMGSISEAAIRENETLKLKVTTIDT
jgi:chromosome segregation ATPase